MQIASICTRFNSRVCALALLGLGACALPSADEGPDAEPRTVAQQQQALVQDVFFDNFATGVTKWTESGEGDWNTEALHAATGYPTTGLNAPAAHSDDCDTGCALLSPQFDVRFAETATLRLLRFVDSELDAGEYLRVEVRSDGKWTTLANWTHLAGDTNRWQAETFDVSAYAGVSDFQIRLSTRSSLNTEHVQVDDVRLTAENAPAGTVSAAMLRRHIERLDYARPNGSPELMAEGGALDYCRKRLIEMGYWTEYKDFTYTNSVVDFLYPGTGTASGRNVVGVKLSAPDQVPQEQIVVSAHLDSVPSCAGANDNASGVAAMLEVARVVAESPRKRSMVFACWDAEELGSVGSFAFAETKRLQFAQINVAFVFDMIGWHSNEENTQELPGGTLLPSLFPQVQPVIDNGYRGNFIGVVGNGPGGQPLPFPGLEEYVYGTPAGAQHYGAALELAAAFMQLPMIAIYPDGGQALLLQDVFRSDHSTFWFNGYNALFITDTGQFRRRQAYHCGQELVPGDPPAEPDTIDHPFFNLTFARDVTEATARTVRWAADE